MSSLSSSPSRGSLSGTPQVDLVNDSDDSDDDSDNDIIDEDDDEGPPPISMFIGGDIDPESARSRPRKDPPRLEPQVDRPVNNATVFKSSKSKIHEPLPNNDVILLESDIEEDDDNSTIMFSDNEDSQPPILMKPTEIVVPPPKPPKKKKKKKNKEKKRHNKDRSPPRLEPIGNLIFYVKSIFVIASSKIITFFQNRELNQRNLKRYQLK